MRKNIFGTAFITFLWVTCAQGNPFTESDAAWLDESRKAAVASEFFESSPAPPDNQPYFTIFVSESMGEARLREAIRLVNSFNQGRLSARLVYRGMLPGETLGEAMRRMAVRLQELKVTEAPIQIDPPAFRRHLITVVPTVLRIQSGSVTDRVEGTVNPQFIVNRRDEDPDRSEPFINHRDAGDTFEIAEVDLIEHMQQKLASMDWSEKKQKAMSRYWANKEFLTLPPARRDNSFEVDPGIVLTEDFYIEGELVHAKGTHLSPFDQVPLKTRYLIFNAGREVEIEYARKLIATKPETENWLLIATEFPEESTLEDVMALQDRVRGAIYLLDKNVKDRFRLKATPTTIIPDGARKVFVLSEVAL